MYDGSVDIHGEMLADRYRKEQDEVRGFGIAKCIELGITGLAVETNSGVGNLTRLYAEKFKRVITNDINPRSIANSNFDSLQFINEYIPDITEKIDLIDIDAYRCPEPEVKALFEQLSHRENRDLPLVLCISDGLGLWMKRRADIKRIKERYLIDDSFPLDERHPWRQHIDLWNNLLKKLCEKYSMKFTRLRVTQTKGLNYVLGSYLIEK